MSEMPIKNHLQGVASPPEGNKSSPLPGQAPPEGLIIQKLVAEVAAGKIPPPNSGVVCLWLQEAYSLSVLMTHRNMREKVKRGGKQQASSCFPSLTSLLSCSQLFLAD